jgi:HD-GYP domain-containing protein (c-di-GMP phosphodiesterase class II)
MGMTSYRRPERLKISLTEMLRALSMALDCVNPRLERHQRRVCLIAMRIAAEMQTKDLDPADLFGAALIHDVGAIGVRNRRDLLEFDSLDARQHTKLGAELLSRFEPFTNLVPIISFHHQPWLDGAGALVDGVPVPIAAHVIHLADRMEVLANGSKNILADAEFFRQKARDHRGSLFHPACVDAFLAISRADGFWLDILSPHLDDQLLALSPLADCDIDLGHFTELAEFFSQLIDSRSDFTAGHSAKVGRCAEMLAGQLGCGAATARRLLVAGYLHDIGTLAIPNQLLDADRSLTSEEYALVRTHSYQTYDILCRLTGLEDIAHWAADHHERLDGSGYPRGLTGRDLSLPARIMAVSDVFIALTERRPYRASLEPAAAMAKLLGLASAGKLDLAVVECLAGNIERITYHPSQAGDLRQFWLLSEHRSPLSARPPGNWSLPLEFPAPGLPELLA